MKNWKRILYFLILNVIVSAVTVWVVVTIFFGGQVGQPTLMGPTLAPQSDGASGDLLVTEPATVPYQPDEPVKVVPELLEIKALLGFGELETEQVLIKHIGEKEVSLVGWQLQDEDGNVFTFPTLTMFQGGAVTIYTREGTSSVVELYWGLDEPIWESGEQAFLLDPDGEIQAVYTVP